MCLFKASECEPKIAATENYRRCCSWKSSIGGQYLKGKHSTSLFTSNSQDLSSECGWQGGIGSHWNSAFEREKLSRRFFSPEFCNLRHFCFIVVQKLLSSCQWLIKYSEVNKMRLIYALWNTIFFK